MALASPITTSFNAGIFSPSLAGHVDAPRRESAVSEMQNLIPMVQGPATRRGGTRFAYETKDSAAQSALLPFEFNVEQAFIIEMGALYFRFYKDNALITETATTISAITQASPPVVTTGVHGYATGDEVFIEGIVGMEELNQRSYHITVASTTTFSLQDREDANIAAPAAAWSSGGTAAKPYEVTTTYTQADLFDSDGHFEPRITQSNDVLYIAHGNYAMATLTRNSDTDWVLRDLDLIDGPYENLNTTATAFKPSGTSGTINLDVEGGRLVDNGHFNTDTDWTKGTGWTIAGGVATATAATGNLSQAITLTNGNSYTVTINLSFFGAGDVTPELGGTAGTTRSTNGIFTETIVAGAGGSIVLNPTTFTGNIATVSVVDITGLTTNGAFAADTDWTKGTGWTIGSGIATASANSTSLSQAHTVTAGNVYELTYDVTGYVSGSVKPYLGWPGGQSGATRTANGTYTETLIAGNDSTPLLQFVAGSSGTQDFSIDNVALKTTGTGINDGDGFVSTDLGRLIRIKDTNSNWTWGQIVGVLSSISVEFEIKGDDLANTNETKNWRMGLYHDATLKQPSSVWLYQGRLTASHEDRVDFTQVAGFTNECVDFTPTDQDGTVNADNAISARLGANGVNDILWIADHEKAIVCGTAAGEWVLRANTIGDALAPDNITINRATREGSAPAQAIPAGNAVLFIQRARRKLHEIGFNFEADGFRSPDMTLLAEDLTRPNILQMTLQRQPQSIIWITRSDGVLLGFTYEREENVLAWHKHVIGGSFSTGDAVVEHVAAIPSADTTRDELWMIVKRTVNSVTRRYVEYMTPLYDAGIGADDAVHVDSSLVYSGSAVTTVRGLNHLEGETVTILNEAKAQPTTAVAAGLITIPNDQTTTKAQIGLPNTWKLQTLEIEVAGPGNTMQGKPKRIDRAIIRYLNTLGISISGDDVTYDDEEFTNFTDFGLPTALFTGDVEHRWPGDYDRKGKIYLQHSGAFPVTILAIMPRLTSSDR